MDQIEIFKQVLSDSNALRDARIEPLKFLVHFVGDVHQPFHAIGEAARRAVASGGIAGAAGAEKSIQIQKETERFLTNRMGRPWSAVPGLGLGQTGPWSQALRPVHEKIVRSTSCRLYSVGLLEAKTEIPVKDSES